ATLLVTAQRRGKLALGEDESYRLDISATGIRLDAESDIGALRGLETLLQLVAIRGQRVQVPFVTIRDEPRFPWRGLMIDAARHFMPIEVIKRNLDGMAAVKLNVLHWHLSEDQGFRVECQSLPKLHQLGSDGLYYTQAQIREIQDYAADRGIRVVPEFDVPGHATSWLVGYPEMGSAAGPYAIERSWGIFDPSMNPTQQETYDFLDAFLSEMATIFDDEFMHIGGDENTGKHWLDNPQIRSFMEAKGFYEPLALQRYFNQHLLEILSRNGKRMIGWDEILQPELPTNIVIQSWRGRESLYEAATNGYSGILSNGYYVDLIQSTQFHYLNDPLPDDAPLAPEERQRILGGEATMWAEYVSPETVDSRIWPRTAAIAERFWSPSSVRDVDDMYRRLDVISRLLEEHGLQHEKNRPMMLRRLCDCRDIEALGVLLGTLEPVKVYRRGQQRKHTQFSPLTRLVDVAWPDAEPARLFRQAVERVIDAGFNDEAAYATARSWLQLWAANHDALAPKLQSTPALAEMLPMAIQLHETAMIGLETLNLLEDLGNAELSWAETRLEKLEQARHPHGQTELMIVDSIKRLVCSAAAQQPEACVIREAETQSPTSH
ncbi:MAG: family 20 glycosylhydrolase, partial [bacterium]|nr:family 20 glycosylhydrolase [bacterium]